MTTVYDVARVAGVSTATVSRVMRESSLVQPETRQRVHEIARRLNYRPNTAAQALRLNRTDIIGFWGELDVRTPFFQELTFGMLNGCNRITEHIGQKLGIGVGQTTPDGKFTLQEVECLGYCDLAPVLQVNFDYHEKITPERVDEIIAGLS